MKIANFKSLKSLFTKIITNRTIILYSSLFDTSLQCYQNENEDYNIILLQGIQTQIVILYLDQIFTNMTFQILKQNMKGNSKQSNSLIPFQGLIYYPFGIYLGLIQPTYLQAYYQMLNQKEQEDVKQEVKEEYDSESIKKEYESKSIDKDCKKNIVKFSLYIWPGETKNYYKNIGKKLSSFIINSFDQPQVKEDPFIIQFINMESQNYNRIHFQRLFHSKIARRIAANFFGNFQWCSQFISQNKTDIDFYLRHNKQMYRRKKRQQQSQFKK
ncbi:unnamed protein product [Paramecium pentaurelia]|uniref:Uncharacterized protein n=1 Tax=Paramecium pentaurelia TaxID=43138 RepID=A0A8S1SNX2_9CILI|nr:unnamed protein product [Paramecium pentaurelia]